MEELQAKSASAENRENKEKLSLRILVADDDASTLRLLKIILEDSGYTVKTVKNGQEILDELKAGGYDLLITDNRMPVKRGIEVLREMRGAESTKNLPVIVLSATLVEIGDEVKALGAVGLSKPFSINTLLEQIKNLTENEESLAQVG